VASTKKFFHMLICEVAMSSGNTDNKLWGTIGVLTICLAWYSVMSSKDYVTNNAFDIGPR
jgi:hypothetical protein